MVNVYKTISREIVDQQITVGDIIDNPYFDANLDYRIVENDENDDWRDLYGSKGAEDDPPAELLIRKVTYLTLGNNTLILEVR